MLYIWHFRYSVIVLYLLFNWSTNYYHMLGIKAMPDVLILKINITCSTPPISHEMWTSEYWVNKGLVLQPTNTFPHILWLSSTWGCKSKERKKGKLPASYTASIEEQRTTWGISIRNKWMLGPLLLVSSLSCSAGRPYLCIVLCGYNTEPWRAPFMTSC